MAITRKPSWTVSQEIKLDLPLTQRGTSVARAAFGVAFRLSFSDMELPEPSGTICRSSRSVKIFTFRRIAHPVPAMQFLVVIAARE